MISYRRLTDEELEIEIDERISRLVNALESISEEILPEEVLHQLITIAHEYNWEGLVITEHYQVYEDYKMNNKGY
jgi:hypothetical protein